MAGGSHAAGRARRIALRDFAYRPRKACVELAAFSAHLYLPYYFGGYEWSIPIRSIAVVDLTVPGTPRTPKELQGEFEGRTITYLFTTARARTATTLLLFAQPQRVPPLRLGPALDPGVRPFLPFGYISSRRRRGAWVDGLLLRFDRPREAVEQMVAAGALPGVYRDGAWRVDRRWAPGRPGSEPPWAARSVDRFDGASRALIISGAMVGWNLPTIAMLLGADVSSWGPERYFDPDISRWAWAAAWGTVGAGFLCRLVAARLHGREPVEGPGPRARPPGWFDSPPAPRGGGPVPRGRPPGWSDPPPPSPWPPGPWPPDSGGPDPGWPGSRSGGRPAPGTAAPGQIPPASSPGGRRGSPPPAGGGMANGASVGTVIGGRRPATRPDPRGADRGRS